MALLTVSQSFSCSSPRAEAGLCGLLGGRKLPVLCRLAFNSCYAGMFFCSCCQAFSLCGESGELHCWPMLSAFESRVSRPYCLVLSYSCDSVSMVSKNGVCLGALLLDWFGFCFLSLTASSQNISVVFCLMKSVFKK